MQITTYFLAAIVSFSGLLLGMLLAKLAPEEQKPGTKYFVFLKKLLFFLIISFFLFFYNNGMAFLLILLLLLTLFLLFNGKFDLIKFLEKYYLAYLILGFIFFYSSKITNLFIIESVLIFLYGIPAASLAFNVKKKNYIDIFINAVFFVPIIGLYLLL